MKWQAAAIRRFARVAARSPLLRRRIVYVLSRVPGVKRRLKGMLVQSGVLPSQAAMANAWSVDEGSLSAEARRVLGDLMRERERIERGATTTAER